MRLMLQRVTVVLCPAILCGLLAGCGGEPAPPAMNAKVTGTVTLNGKPIGPLAVNLYSMVHGNIAKAEIDKNGQFQHDAGVPVGEYIFYLSGPAAGSAPSGVPDKYFMDTGTDQRFELKPGDNTVTMELKK